MNTDSSQQHATLQQIARRVMAQRGLLTESSPAAIAELQRIQSPLVRADGAAKDLRDLPWASIDNDDSLDLDQLTVAQVLPDRAVKILVAVADVDGLVKKGSAINSDARHNTTSIYTAAQVFPMLPQRLSTDLTSLRRPERPPGHRDRDGVCLRWNHARLGYLRGDGPQSRKAGL